jgi:hypothetical protein
MPTQRFNIKRKIRLVGLLGALSLFVARFQSVFSLMGSPIGTESRPYYRPKTSALQGWQILLKQFFIIWYFGSARKNRIGMICVKNAVLVFMFGRLFSYFRV